jgi:hypothetical protein
MKLLEQYKRQITGWVKHSMDDGSVNAALTFVAGQQSSELLVAASTASTVALLKSWQLPMAKDCTGMTSLDAYKLRGAAAFSGTMISFQVTSQWSNLAEYAVFARAPTSALRICIVATLAFCDRCATPRLTGAPTCGFWRLLVLSCAVAWECTHAPPNAPSNWTDVCTKANPGGGAAASLAVSEFNQANDGLKVRSSM